MTTLRLAVRLARFELLLVALVLGGITIVWAVIIIALGQPDLLPCLSVDTPACRDTIALADMITSPAPILGYVLSGVSLLGGLMLGVGVVASELEAGTAVFAWSFGTSRSRWLVHRLLALGAVLTVLVLVPALVADLWQHAREIPPSGADTLDGHQLRGLVVVGRALFAFGLGTLAGALIGRALPALLLGLVALGLVLGVTEMALDNWRTSEAVVVTEDSALPIRWLYIDTERHDGLIDGDTAAARLAPDDPAFGRRFESVIIGIPSERGGEIVARETLIYFGAAALCAAGALGVVMRRRPY